jgi:lipid A 3-O-deacylase
MLAAKRSLTGLFALLASATAALPAHAGDYMSINIGKFDVFDDTHDATQFGAEYRGEYLGYDIRPIAGGFFTSEGSVYGYVGLNWDVALLPQQLYLIPNFAIGAYSEGDDGKDLGGTLEFRSGIELAYQFPNAHQLGVALNHISNASIYDRNPGEETLMVTYSVPLNTVSNLIGGH